ncbi:thioester reductase domain-containing protein [Paraburkholderia sp. CNPSo 3281]|uniref:thioester reductase domain-containing protein n=1 Tax=Paraburkholderia sp. CNPSo 3281 TaxID=2940933 RepID=UPI0020B8C5E4|nr:thioester reductase domain-containing protein [Paraburkholderia sp. CNPSo 3281]MCP3717392.1 thioester reductase domain-containing protein [Paraburkholderia sp. CNPSo 3281]
MLLEQISHHADDHPERAAVVAGDRQLTYAQLRARGAAITAVVLAETLERGALVAVFLNRTTDAIAAIVGVMSAGMAYTVVENEGNATEHAHRLAAIAPALVLTDEAGAAALSGRNLRVARLPKTLGAASAGAQHGMAPAPSADELAYVLFTSGSTGVPKGVMITHGNLAHYVEALQARLDVRAPLAYAHVSTLAADLGNTSLMLSLWTGGTLHLIDHDLRKDPAALAAHLAGHGIQFLKITPSHWNLLLRAFGAEAKQGWRLDYLVLGGEALGLRLAADTLRSGVVRTLVNHYGPTETTVGALAFPVPDASAVEALPTRTVPVGLPLGRTRALVRTDDGAFHADSATGELYLGGPSVSPGYRGNPEATAVRFMADVEGDTRFYRTGDLVSIDAAGVVEFLGRVDRQVKINGYRVELEHVESALRSIPNVDAAGAFLVEIHGKTALAAAYSPAIAEVSTVRARLAEIVPPYLIPKWLEAYDALPRNANGKTNLAEIRQAFEVRLAQGPAANAEQAAQAGQAATPAPVAVPERGDDPVAAEALRGVIRGVWTTVLGHDGFDNCTSFFELGGDSLDAIQVIAELQAMGYRVTANAFLREPTVEALTRDVFDGEPQVAHRGGAAAADVVPQFSVAQRDFLAQGFAQADHYNQAIMLQSDRPLAIEVLRRVVGVLQRWHPMLAAQYRERDGEWSVHFGAVRPSVGMSSIDTLTEDEAIDTLIRTAAQVYQSTLSLDGGRVFAAHLFTRRDGPHQLLLIAHHLSIDVISWRVIVSDLGRLYSLLEKGDAPVTEPAGTPFHAWAAHLPEAGERLADALAFWRGLRAEGLLETDPHAVALDTEDCTETAWLRFSADETRALLQSSTDGLHAPFHHLFLAAFLQVLHDAQGDTVRRTVVDIESHGRVSFDERVDVSRTVGWFTSTYPLPLSSTRGNLTRTVEQVHAMLAAVPDLGVAYGLRRDALVAEWGKAPAARLCYNYLGEFNFARDPALSLTPSRYNPGTARGGENARTHDLKLTARVLAGQLVVDLSFNARRRGGGPVKALLEALHGLLLENAGLPADGSQVVLERGTSTGLIAYAPAALRWEARDQVGTRRAYRHVLLTGASGYLGIHALHDLLTRTDAHVTCLVRDKGAEPAAARLAETFGWYFPELSLAAFGARLSVVGGDLGQDRFGLDADTYRTLARHVDAIYHFAADTRLFADDATLQRENVEGTRRVIELAGSECQKDLHHVSTLAVAGVNRKGSPVIFDEAALDVGQDFLNAYERSKFKAEQLVRAFFLNGGAGAIYRTGNVSGHSRTSRFQRNGADNRFIQFLRAALKAGERPRQLGEDIVLSPVDRVVEAIVTLSLHGEPGGQTFHVDSPWPVTIASVLDALEAAGERLAESAHPTFADVFGKGEQSHDRDVSLGYFWARREQRDVVYNNDHTLALLGRLGFGFEPLDAEWLKQFVGQLAAAGALPVRREITEAAGAAN